MSGERRCFEYALPRRRLADADAATNSPLSFATAVDRKEEVQEAIAFFKKALKRHGKAEAIVTDGLKSYPAALKELGIEERREMARWLNNRAENSHLPFRRRERAMLRFRQMKSSQKFALVHVNVHNHFNSDRHLNDRQTYKENRSAAPAEWKDLMA